MEQFSRVSLPETPLSEFKRGESDGGDSHAVIVIGGETHGVSKRAHKFALENRSSQLTSSFRFYSSLLIVFSSPPTNDKKRNFRVY